MSHKHKRNWLYKTWGCCSPSDWALSPSAYSAVSSAVQSTKVLWEPIQTIEKWRWKNFPVLRTSVRYLWQWMYHSKITTYGPEYYAVSYGQVACMLLCTYVSTCILNNMCVKGCKPWCVYAICVWQYIYCSSSQGLDHLKHLETLNLYPHCIPSVKCSSMLSFTKVVDAWFYNKNARSS